MGRIWQSGGTSVSGSPSIGLLRQDLAAVLEHSEEAVAIGRERKAFWRRQAAFDAVNAHSQATSRHCPSSWNSMPPRASGAKRKLT
jgi:hypothetical protein